MARRVCTHTEAARLAQNAEYTAATVDAYVFRRILDAAVLGRVPDVRRAAAAGNDTAFDQAAVMEMDRRWQSDRAAVAAHSGLLQSSASQFLADIVGHDPIYREILVTDRQGRLVAASNVTSDYFQADEDWWRVVRRRPRPRRRQRRAARPERRRLRVRHCRPGTGADRRADCRRDEIVADSREMLVGIAGLNLGRTGEAMLVRPDGSITSSAADRPIRRDRFFAADLLGEHLAQREQLKQEPGPLTFTAGGESGPAQLVAVAPGQIARSYPTLNWLVALSVERDEITAPFRSLVWYLVIVFALTAVAVLAIALWLSLRLAAPVWIPPSTCTSSSTLPAWRMRRSPDNRGGPASTATRDGAGGVADRVFEGRAPRASRRPAVAA